MGQYSYGFDNELETFTQYFPRLRDDSRTLLEYEGALPEYEDAADHYTQYRRNFNVL